MGNYLLDTNIIIIYSRDNNYSSKIEEKFKMFSGDNELYISIVTLGELDAFIKNNKLGVKKQERIKKLVNSVNKIGIEYGEIISLYGDIDSFNQGKLKIEGHQFSSIKMGKNDLWIAATASHYDLKLLTTDKDFVHLRDVYLELEYIRLDILNQ